MTLPKNELTTDSVHILIVAYKAKKQLEIHTKKRNETVYKLISTYNACASSGELEPKRMGTGIDV